MKDWNPRSVWNELKRALRGAADDDESDEPAADPTLAFHLVFSVPLLLGLIFLARR